MTAPGKNEPWHARGNPAVDVVAVEAEADAEAADVVGKIGKASRKTALPTLLRVAT